MADYFKHPPLTPLATELRRARLAKGLTMAETARAIDARYETFAKWEAGKTEPQARAFARWCAFLGVDPIAVASA